MADADPALARPAAAGAPEILAQVAYAAREEMAVTLGDALLRRTGIGFGPRQGLDGLPSAAHVMTSVLGWDAAREAAEMEAYRLEIEPMRRFASVETPAA
jgi:glycerol-3-phosphate dehydrogenase